MAPPRVLLAAWAAAALAPAAGAVPLKLAAAQVLTNDGDFPGNLHRVSTAVAAAARGGADLVAFPETSLDGWMTNSAIHVAPPVPGNWSDTIAQLAADHSIWVLIGIVETEGDQLFDVAILVDDTGKLVMKHRKNNIVCKNAGCNYTPGHNVTVAQTPWGKLGVLICADTFDSSVVQRMAALQPDVLLVPYGFQAPPEQNVENGRELVQRVSVTAKAVGAPMAGINNVGAVGGLTGAPGKSPIGATYCGWSNWADKTGKTMAVAADRDVDLAFWTIDTNKAPDTAAVRVNCAAVDNFKTLQAALSRNHAAVTLAAKRTCEVSGPLVIDQVTNLNVTIEQGAELQAQRGSHRFGVLLTVQSSSDVVIQGQPAASGASGGPPEDPYNIRRDDYQNTSLFNHSEHRHLLQINDCSRLTVRNLRLFNSGGDGVYVESVRHGLLADLTVDHNYRQGLSIIEAQGLVVTDCVFASTLGTAPMAGIDLEPNKIGQQIIDVEIRSTRLLRNAGAGVQLALATYTNKSPPFGVNFTDVLVVGPDAPCTQYDPACSVSKPYYRWGVLVEAWADSLPQGHVQFNGLTVIDAAGWSSPPVWVEKPAGDGQITVGFSNLTISTDDTGPAITAGAIHPASGGITVDGAVIDRTCCPGGVPFLSAQNSGANQIIDVSVSDVEVRFSAKDNASQAATECSCGISANAMQNGVTCSRVSCRPMKTDDGRLNCAKIASKYSGRWSKPPQKVPTQKLVDGPILGNGDLGVVAGGPAEKMTFFVGLNQFWALHNWTHGSVGHLDLRPFPSPVAVARVVLSAPGLVNATYNFTQDIASALVRGEFGTAAGSLSLTAWVEPDRNTFGLRVHWDGATPLAAHLSVETGAAICVNSTIDGPSGEEICVAGELLPVVASSGRVGSSIAWAKRMAAFPSASYNLTAATTTRLLGVDDSDGGVAAPPPPSPAQSVPTVSTTLRLSVRGTVTAMTSVVTSRDIDPQPDGQPPRGSNADPLPIALALARNSSLAGAAKSLTTTVESQRRSWDESCVSLPPQLVVLERFWYGAIYSMRAASRAGKYPPGLWGPWITSPIGLAGWHGDYTLDYNYQASYYGLFSSNRLGIADAFYAPMLDYVASGQAEAESASHGCPGAYHFPSHVGAYGYDTTLAAMDWHIPSCPGDSFGSLSISWNGIFAALPFLWRWEYGLDTSLLRKHYPFLQKLLAFWDCHLINGPDGPMDYGDCGWECCGGTRPDPSGEDKIGDPNIAGSADPIMTVALLPRFYDILPEMAAAAGQPASASKQAEWAALAAGLRSPKVWTVGTGQYNNSGLLLRLNSSTTIYGWQGRGFTRPAAVMKGNGPVNFAPVWPYEVVGQHSSAADMRVARDTINFMESWNNTNGFMTVFPACIHAGMVDCIPRLISAVDQTMLPNLMAYQIGGGLEMAGGLEAVNAMLMQSTGGFISLFPVLPPLPAEDEVSFSRLRAKGAFVVSATLAGGQITFAEVESERGTRCVVALPAHGDQSATRVVAVRQGGQKGGEVALAWRTLRPSGKVAFSFATSPGATYQLSFGKP